MKLTIPNSPTPNLIQWPTSGRHIIKSIICVILIPNFKSPWFIIVPELWLNTVILPLFILTCYTIWPLAPPRDLTQGHLHHEVKGLGLCKYHTKFQLCSVKATNVISSKRNAEVNAHVNADVNWWHLLDSGYERDIRTYARTDVTSRRNAICPPPAFGRRGHKNIVIKVTNTWKRNKYLKIIQCKRVITRILVNIVYLHVRTVASLTLRTIFTNISAITL